jgi:two-component system response regulator FlrC
MKQEIKIFLYYEGADKGQLLTSLTNSGYKIYTHADLQTVIKSLKSQRYDAAILSFNPDDTQNMEFISWIEKKEQNFDIPMIFIAGHPKIEDAIKLMRLGAADYLFSPVDINKLLFVLKNSLDAATVCSAKTNSRDEDIASDQYKIITQSPLMQKILIQSQNIAKSNVPVLITGESGTGKELLARFIHNHSDRNKEPFIAVNCAALPETLLESELFGYEKGAFSGATSRKPGKFEIANHGTLLLDEISEMNVTLQAKLLRVIQEGEIDRLGGTNPVKVDVRIITTSNRDMEEEIKKGNFRSDLYYRINVIPFKLPSLRERKEDIPILAMFYLDQFSRKYQKKGMVFANDVIKRFEKMNWHGNIRELRNFIERALLLSMDNVITWNDVCGDFLISQGNENEIPECKPDESDTFTTISEMEESLIKNALAKTQGNRTHAARLLGISVRTLRNKLSEYRQKWGITL